MSTEREGSPIYGRRTHAGQRVPLAWPRLLLAQQRLTAVMDAQLRTRHGLTLREYEILLMLGWAKDRRLRRVDLASRLLVTQGGVTRLLAGLERRGLVRSEPGVDDRRVVWAVLEDEGLALLERAAPGHVADVDRLFTQHFDETELALLAEHLGRLLEGAAPGGSVTRDDGAHD